MRLANWEGREGEEEALSGFEVLALNNNLFYVEGILYLVFIPVMVVFGLVRWRGTAK